MGESPGSHPVRFCGRHCPGRVMFAWFGPPDRCTTRQQLARPGRRRPFSIADSRRACVFWKPAAPRLGLSPAGGGRSPLFSLAVARAPSRRSNALGTSRNSGKSTAWVESVLSELACLLFWLAARAPGLLEPGPPFIALFFFPVSVPGLLVRGSKGRGSLP